MMNEIINKIFVVGEFKRHAEFELNEFKKEFGEYIAKNFSDRVILKNGVEIIAISAIEFRRVKVRDFKACHSEDFMRYVYRNKVKELQQENKQLKEKINTYENPEDLTLMFMYCDEKAKDKIKQLKEVIEEVRKYIDNMIVYGDDDEDWYFKEVHEEHYEKLLQILNKVKEN